jgi:translation initiation factor IF-1
MTLVNSTGAVITAISLSLVTFDVTRIEAQPQSGSSSSKTVIGEVSAVEGEFHMAKNSLGEDILKMVDKSYIITTPTGQEIQLKLSGKTKVPTRANPGDRIEAEISDKGQTLSVMLIE